MNRFWDRVGRHSEFPSCGGNWFLGLDKDDDIWLIRHDQCNRFYISPDESQSGDYFTEDELRGFILFWANIPQRVHGIDIKNRSHSLLGNRNGSTKISSSIVDEKG